MDHLTAFWQTSEENRTAFVRGKHIGRAIITGAALSAVAVVATAAALPVWGLWCLGAIGLSVVLSNVIGFTVDQDKQCQSELGRVAAKNPGMAEKKVKMFAAGLMKGLFGTLKMLPLEVVGTPFWPVIIVAMPLVNKGTAGYYLFAPKNDQSSASAPPSSGSQPAGLPSPVAKTFNAATPPNPPPSSGSNNAKNSPPAPKAP